MESNLLVYTEWYCVTYPNILVIQTSSDPNVFG